MVWSTLGLIKGEILVHVVGGADLSSAVMGSSLLRQTDQRCAAVRNVPGPLYILVIDESSIHILYPCTHCAGPRLDSIPFV